MSTTAEPGVFQVAQPRVEPKRFGLWYRLSKCQARPRSTLFASRRPAPFARVMIAGEGASLFIFRRDWMFLFRRATRKGLRRLPLRNWNKSRFRRRAMAFTSPGSTRIFTCRRRCWDFLARATGLHAASARWAANREARRKLRPQDGTAAAGAGRGRLPRQRVERTVSQVSKAFRGGE